MGLVGPQGALRFGIKMPVLSERGDILNDLPQGGQHGF